MNASTYLKNLSLNIPSRLLHTRDGLTYLSWEQVVRNFGCPEHRVLEFNGRPFLPMLGGAIVGVEMNGQEVFLPVMDEANRPIRAKRITARDIASAIDQCRVKAVAVTTGLGLSLYAGYDGNGERFAKDLAVEPETDLSQVKPLTRSGKTGEYIIWPAAIAAAMITAPFFWKVKYGPDGLPYAEVNGGYLVGVEVSYLGKHHTEWLPEEWQFEPTVFDWNMSVIRCLTRAIAMVSGYGRRLYVGGGSPAELERIRSLLKQAGKAEDALCKWLKVESLETADQEAIARAEKVLSSFCGKQGQKQGQKVANPFI